MTVLSKLKAQITAGAITLVLALGGYIWTGHVSAEAAAMQATNRELKELRDIVIRLDAYIANQQELNEWFVTEHQRHNRSAH